MSANSWAATLRFHASEAGAAAVELAIIFPFLLMVTFGILEFSFVLYQMNMAEKATQFGVRKAVTWDPVAPELATYAGSGAAGTPLPAGLQVDITCDNTGCTGAGAIANPTLNSAAFNAVVGAMANIPIASSNGLSTIALDVVVRVNSRLYIRSTCALCHLAKNSALSLDFKATAS